MRMKSMCLVSIISVSLAAVALAAAGSGYHVMTTYKVGGDGGWDYLTADPDARRVYISRGTHVMVLDADSGKVVGDIADTPGVHGIALAPELGNGFTSNGREGTVSIFDIKTLATSTKVKVGDNPDAILYDPATKRVFTFNGRSQDSTAIDATNGKVLGTIKLDGKPEFAASDAKGEIFVNIEDKSELVAIDPNKLEVESEVAAGAVHRAERTLDRPQEPSPVRGLRQQNDGGGGRRQRQGAGNAGDWRRSGCNRIRCRDRAGVRLLRR